MNDRTVMNKVDNNHTRGRILDEAEALFALKGYDAVGIREITGAANCNLAAVNYHFGNKKNLYLEVFRSRWLPRAMRIRNYFQDSLKACGRLTPSAIVESLARAFLQGPFADEERERHYRLISGEMTKPTEAFKMVADEAIQPLFEILGQDLRSVLWDDIEEEKLALNVLSVFAMVLYFNFTRQLISNLTGCDYDADFKARLIDHIVEFSINGLSAESKETRP